jgi:hypothetical protein
MLLKKTRLVFRKDSRAKEEGREEEGKKEEEEKGEEDVDKVTSKS